MKSIRIRGEFSTLVPGWIWLGFFVFFSGMQRQVSILNRSPHTDLPGPEVVFETDRILAVCKPGGLLTQAPPGIDSMEVRVRQYLANKVPDSVDWEKGKGNGKVYLGVPHRLDRPASGIMVFAKDKPAARHLAAQFQNRQVRKSYWALVQMAGSGNDQESQILVQGQTGIWQDWMRKIPDQAKSEICQERDADAKLARLGFRVLAVVQDKQSPNLQSALLEIDLETGRSHQIRLQSSSRDTPIVGDATYGSTQAFGPDCQDLRDRWIALHARQLSVRNPADDEMVELTAGLPEFWPTQLRFLANELDR